MSIFDSRSGSSEGAPAECDRRFTGSVLVNGTVAVPRSTAAVSRAEPPVAAPTPARIAQPTISHQRRESAPKCSEAQSAGRQAAPRTRSNSCTGRQRRPREADHYRRERRLYASLQGSRWRPGFSAVSLVPQRLHDTTSSSRSSCRRGYSAEVPSSVVNARPGASGAPRAARKVTYASVRGNGVPAPPRACAIGTIRPTRPVGVAFVDAKSPSRSFSRRARRSLSRQGRRGLRGSLSVLSSPRSPELFPSMFVRSLHGGYARRSRGSRFSVFVLMAASIGSETESAAAATTQTVVSITFDDGWADQDQGLPILQAHNMDATYYLNSPRIGADSACMTWQTSLPSPRPAARSPVTPPTTKTYRSSTRPRRSVRSATTATT